MNKFLVNNLPLVDGHLRMAKSGVWTAYDILVDTDVAFKIGDPVTMNILDVTFNGTIYNSDVYLGFQRCTILGGSGKLNNSLESVPYNATTVGQVFKDIARKTGHEVSTKSDQSIINFSLSAWNILKMKASLAIEKLMTTTQSLWRILPDGTLWTGMETYIPLNDQDFIILEKFPDEGRWSVYNENYLIQPLTSLQGNNIVQVDYFIKDNNLNMDIYFADISADSVQELTNQDDNILYNGTYRTKVIKQDSTTGNLDLLPDPNFDIIRNGFVNVPIVYPFPGMKITVPNGTACYVTFANGSPQLPRVTGWDDSGAATKVEMIHTDPQKAARVTDSVDCGKLEIDPPTIAGAASFYWTPPGSVVKTLIGNIASPTLTGAGSVASVVITGTISTGSNTVFIGS